MMDSKKELYDNLCKEAQQLNDIIDDVSKELSREQMKDLIEKIGNINNQLNEIYKKGGLK